MASEPAYRDPGSVLAGIFRIERALGRGGMGDVYEATRLDSGQSVAIKVLRRQLVTDRVLLERFRREAGATASLGHPNIVRVGAMHEDGETVCYEMELLPGRTLWEALRTEGRFEPARAARIVREMLSGLDAAHRAGIVHRDLKPGNVFLASTPDGETPVILDFGIAALEEGEGYQRLTATGVIVGTPGYLSPEQALGRPVDARSDLFSTGVILYMLLAGRRPFEAPGPAEVLYRVCEEDPDPLEEVAPDVPPELARIVRQALSKAPADRFASASEMAAALEPWSAEATPVPATPPHGTALPPPATREARPPSTRTGKPPEPDPAPPNAPKKGRSPLLVAALTFGIVLVVAGGIGGVVLFAELVGPSSFAAPSADPTAGGGGGGGSGSACEEYARVACDCVDPEIRNNHCPAARRHVEAQRAHGSGGYERVCRSSLDLVRGYCTGGTVDDITVDLDAADLGIPACRAYLNTACQRCATTAPRQCEIARMGLRNQAAGLRSNPTEVLETRRYCVSANGNLERSCAR